MAGQAEQESQRVTIRVSPPERPQRLDRFLSAHPDLDLTRTRIQKLIVEKNVLVDGRPVAKNHTVKGGEQVEITIPPPAPTDLKAEDIPLDIVYEDEHIAVVNKPAGLVTHPAPGHYAGTLVNALVHHFKQLAAGSRVERPGIIHRLDKNTSGLLLVAKSDPAYLKLQQHMQQRRIKRTYLALVCGHMKEVESDVVLPIGRSLKDRKKMAVTGMAGREAQTHYRVQERFRTYDLLEVNLLTGRTHQIRVHFSHLGHPVFGDPDYGGRQKWHRGAFGPERQFGQKLLSLIDRQALHAWKLRFTHPMNGQDIVLQSELPGDFEAVLSLLRKEGS